jgi:FkbM family methyltransferase
MKKNKYIRIINSVLNCRKYIQNISVIFTIPFKKEITLKFKNDVELLIKNFHFVNVIELMEQGWKINKDKDIVYFERGNMKVSVIESFILTEDFSNYCKYSKIEGKNVLDIGGLYGETSIYFLKEKNANKCFVYEPVIENCEKIKQNIKLNELYNKLILFEKGIGKKEGEIIIESNSPPTTGCFGLEGNKYKYKMNVEKWNTILSRHLKDNIELCKCDCEGGEQYLIYANPDLIRKIKHWSIEVHSHKIAQQLKNMFFELGYSHEEMGVIDEDKGVIIYHFWIYEESDEVRFKHL